MNSPANLHAETGALRRTYLLARAWWSSRFSPPSATSLHAPCGGVVWLDVADRSGLRCRHGPRERCRLMDWRGLLLARRIRQPRRHMGSRRRVRPDRLRHPRGLRGADEAKETCEEMGAVLLKHRQDGFWGEGNQCVHGVTLSVRILTDGSGETASTPKIVSDVGPKALLRSGLDQARSSCWRYR